MESDCDGGGGSASGSSSQPRKPQLQDPRPTLPVTTSSRKRSLDDDSDSDSCQLIDFDEKQAADVFHQTHQRVTAQETRTELKETTVSFRTRSDVTLLDDRFKWKKYGKKTLRSSPFSRSYYKCATEGCHVKKHVQRDADDPSYCITTYRGVHTCFPPFLHSSHLDGQSDYDSSHLDVPNEKEALDLSSITTAQEMSKKVFKEELDLDVPNEKKALDLFSCAPEISKKVFKEALDLDVPNENASIMWYLEKLKTEGTKLTRETVSFRIKNDRMILEHLERCLSYCLLFPPGHEFERDSMVQLWIAEDVIDGEATERSEDKGYTCFQLLLSHGYIESSELHNKDDPLKYKVSECYANRGSFSDDFLIISRHGFSNISRTCQHLSLPDEKFDCQIPEIIQTCQRLRTLLLLGHTKYLVKQIPRDLFLSLNLLRTVVLSGTQVSDVPSSVGNLEDLRYFDLSGTLIRELPGVLCDLVSLQTLKLRDCFEFTALPKGMMKLINLRHLDLDIVHQLSYMPKRMGRLVNLQTFKGFIVGTEEECGIGELYRLNNITGSFCLSCLENVANVEEAKMADLRSKIYITKLVLRWEECINADSEQEILECLLPHPNLSELQIQFFSGSALPSWISDPSFIQLISITFYKCINCSFLPRIGKLPSLKFLNILGIDKVIDIDGMFCYDYEESSYPCSFPSLEKLIIENMSQLEKWAEIKTHDFRCLGHLSIRNCPRLAELPSMSSLNSLIYLELISCSELECLPDMPASLETLIIQDCPTLQEQCRNSEGRDWPKFSHVPNVWIQHRQISPA